MREQVINGEEASPLLSGPGGGSVPEGALAFSPVVQACVPVQW